MNDLSVFQFPQWKVAEIQNLLDEKGKGVLKPIDAQPIVDTGAQMMAGVVKLSTDAIIRYGGSGKYTETIEILGKGI